MTIVLVPRPDLSTKPAKEQPKDNLRETIESVVIAFVLAFLFRTFEAEAFVIPTGSMAPTLMGQHRDVNCPDCHTPFQVNASHEQTHRADSASYICPNCFLKTDFGPRVAGAETPPASYRGDRILVAKFPYDLYDPSRFDVIVFKYPIESKQNYIKRCVGLPNETLRIHRGDIHARPEGAREFAIQRKYPEKLRAMLQLVYDNDHQSPELNRVGWPQRWQPAAAEGGWQANDDSTRFTVAANEGSESRLVYRHIAPCLADWEIIQGRARAGAQLRPLPQLITDFYAYNSGSNPHTFADPRGHHWVGDLAMQCELSATSDVGEAVFELVEGGRVFRAAFDLASGKATLGIDGEPNFAPTAQTSVRGGTTHDIMFANADDALYLFVDGEPVEFDQPATYPALGNDGPTNEDLTPARVVSRGAELEVANLKIWRDMYYIADAAEYGQNRVGATTDYEDFESWPNNPYSPEWSEIFADPERVRRRPMRTVEFELGPDQFLMCGDNSPCSKDSRLWDDRSLADREFHVHRDLLVGKAFYIYWPHAIKHIPGTNLWAPWFPNFPRMGLVR